MNTFLYYCEILIDINECIVNNGGCQHMCNDTEGSFECYCRDGYSLNPNKFLCDGMSIYSFLYQVHFMVTNVH